MATGTFHLPISVIGGTSSATASWTPPVDWIDISSVGNNEINLLVADMSPTQFQITTAGTFSINWGDGTIETNRASITTYQHTYTVGAGQACSRGYTTFKIRIYEAASNITKFAIQNPSASTTAHTVPVLWCVMGTTGLTSMANAFSVSNGSICGMMECLTLPPTLGSLQTISSMCQNNYSLIQVTGPTGSWGFTNVGGCNSTFFSCYSLKYVSLFTSFASCNSCSQMFYACYGLQNITLPSSWGSIINVSSMFAACYGLQNITLPSSWGSVNDVSNMFSTCQDLTTITLPSSLSWGSITTINQMFYSCLNLRTINNFPTSWGSVANIGSVFYSVQQLKSLTLPATMGNITTASSVFAAGYDLNNITNFNMIGSTVSACNMTTILQLNDVMTQAFTMSSLLSAFGISGAAGKAIPTTSIRLTNTASTFGGTSPQVNVSYTGLTASGIDALFGDLPTLVGKTINITGCPGTASCTRSIATIKGWSVSG